MSETSERSSAAASDQDSQGNPSAEQARIAKAYEKPSYRYLVLGILTVVYVFNFVDRQVINVLAQPIITDLEISDGQFGMLSGLAEVCSQS